MGKWNRMMALHYLSLLQFSFDQLKIFALIQLFERHLRMVIIQALSYQFKLRNYYIYCR